MAAIYKKEFQAYFRNLTGYIFVFFILLIFGIYTGSYCLYYKTSYFEYVFRDCTYLFLFAIPILTMRSLAEERRQKTDQLLYSLPVSMTQIVMGKYFAMVTIFAIPVGVSALFPLILKLYDPSGYLSFTTIYSVILAFFLLGCAMIAIGMFMSSLTENQIIAAVLSFAASLILFLMSSLRSLVPSGTLESSIGLAVIVILLSVIVLIVTHNKTAAWLVFVVLEIPIAAISIVKPELMEGALPAVLNTLSVFERFNNFLEGVFDVKALIYLISIAAVFNFFSVQSMEKRRYS